MFGTDLIGRPISEVDTPALVIDADVMDANVKRMAEFFELTVRYEIAFWEMAATGEGWPGGSEK
jgi:thiaminase